MFTKRFAIIDSCITCYSLQLCALTFSLFSAYFLLLPHCITTLVCTLMQVYGY